MEEVIYRISVYVHILVATFWIGGMLFLVFVELPVIRKQPFNVYFKEMVRAIGKRFSLMSWIFFIIIFITGTYNIFYRGYSLSELLSFNFWLDTNFGRKLAHKIVIFFLVILLSYLHDFVYGPKATSSSNNPFYSKATKWIGRLNLILALIILWLATQLVRG